MRKFLIAAGVLAMFVPAATANAHQGCTERTNPAAGEEGVLVVPGPLGPIAVDGDEPSDGSGYLSVYGAEYNQDYVAVTGSEDGVSVQGAFSDSEGNHVADGYVDASEDGANACVDLLDENVVGAEG